MRSRVRPVLWVAIACVLPACASRDDGSSTTPTFARDVAPILFTHCATCHRPGEAAPFSLLAYTDAQPRAKLISEVVTSRYMPPWMPEPGHGDFVGARRLTDAQIDVIRRWVDGGAPEGDARNLPPRPAWTDGWQLGKPDLVIEVAEAYRMAAEGLDQFRTFIVPVPLPAMRYVRAVEFRPGSPRSVHHAVLRVARGRAVAAGGQMLDEGDSDGMLLSEASIASPDGHLLGWAPGYAPNVAPPDMPWSIEPGTALAIELHLQSTGKVEEVKPSVGLFFTDRVPARIPFGLQLGSYTIDIPPGDSNYTIEDRYILPVDVEVLAIYPHAHYLGRDLRAWARLPDGSERALIWIKNWDFNWQNAYRYVAPLALPRGTTIAMRYVYDNSAGNPRNPRQPPQPVQYGGQSTDEMGNLWLQVVPRNGSDLALLRADYSVKSAERQIVGYEHLLKQRPAHAGIRRALADAHNFIGVSFHERGQSAEAGQAFARAIAVWPSHAPARNNLGSVFRGQGRAREAVREYRAALAIDPDYADAHFNLGLILQGMGNLAEAARHLQRTVELTPAAPEAHNALAWLLATDRRSSPTSHVDALRLAQRAVELTRERDASALDTLAAAHAALGEFERAVAVAERALAVTTEAGQAQLADDIRQRLVLYRSRKPYYQ